MWILDTNSTEFLQGKRMWLKPGQRYLFGRVKTAGVQVAIDHKTVSRQHFIIKVDEAKEGDVGNVHARTKIRVEDQSKTGTIVNGDLLKKKDPKDESQPNPSKELKETKNSILPASCPWEFTVTWHPHVFTFNLLKKEIKSGALKEKHKSVQEFDIKAISEFSSEHTTHVVAAKRNTPKGLQALVSGKHLVTEAFVDSLKYTATPLTLSQDINLSPLEIDFNGAWPKEQDFLPPPGKELSLKPPEAYKPDPARASVFEHYTFVFCDQSQYENLMPVITGGHGKAILFKVINAETTGDDLFQYLQNAAGHKRGGGQNGFSKGGVVLVRSSLKDNAHQEWTTKIVNEAVLRMDQRAIEQSEFLEAILSNEASLLKQPVPYESTNDSIIAPPPSAANSLVSQHPTQARMDGVPTSQTSETGRTREGDTSSAVRPTASAAQQSPVTASGAPKANLHVQNPAPKPFIPKVSQVKNFKNFDDGFDSNAIADYDDDEVPDDDEYMPNGRIEQRVQTQTSSVKQEPQSARKRPRSPSEERADAFGDEMDDFLPAATALKRRKLEAAAANGRPVEEPPVQKAPAKTVKKTRVIDVLEAVKNRQAEKDSARQDDGDLDLPDVEDRAPTHLVEVLGVALPVRDKNRKNNGDAVGQDRPEWDPKWNGRRNFKLFRRKGDPPQRRNHASKVIVPLEEVSNKTGGRGDQYWARTEEERELEKEKKRKELARSQRATQSQTQQSSRNKGRKSNARVILDDDDDEEMNDFRNGLDDDDQESERHTSPATSRLQREAEEIAEHEIDLSTPRQTRATDHTFSANGSETEGREATQKRTQTQKGKRPASSKADTSKAKRQKTMPVTAVRDDDSDEDDGTKFRFGSRRRRGRGRGGRA